MREFVTIKFEERKIFNVLKTNHKIELTKTFLFITL